MPIGVIDHINDFYPRPPRGGRRCVVASSLTDCRFLSTPSARRATREVQGREERLRDFYPRPPRGGRRRLCRCTGLPTEYFYPRPPRGGRLWSRAIVSRPDKISIHALREEGDGKEPLGWLRVGDFYPRPPRGGRQQKQRQNLYFLINYTTFCTNLEEL